LQKTETREKYTKTPPYLSKTEQLTLSLNGFNPKIYLPPLLYKEEPKEPEEEKTKEPEEEKTKEPKEEKVIK
jgi:hypothetical protein